MSGSEIRDKILLDTLGSDNDCSDFDDEEAPNSGSPKSPAAPSPTMVGLASPSGGARTFGILSSVTAAVTVHAAIAAAIRRVARPALRQASSMSAGIRKPRTDTVKRSIIVSVTAAMAVRDVLATVACRMARLVVEPAASLADDVCALPCALQQRIALMATPSAPAVVAELQHAFELGVIMGCALARLHYTENRHTNEGLHELPAANICAVQYLRGRYGALCQVIQPTPHMKKPFFNFEMTIDEFREFADDPDFPMDEYSAWANDMDLSFTGPADPVRECQALPTSFEYVAETSYWTNSGIDICVAMIESGKRYTGVSFDSGGLTPIRPPPPTSTFSFVRPPLSERH
jgi:hypothetical protein